MSVKCIGIQCKTCKVVIVFDNLGHGYMTYCKCKKGYQAVDRITGVDGEYRYVGDPKNRFDVFIIDKCIGDNE